MRHETFDQIRTRSIAQTAIGDSLAAAAFERGETLTVFARQALAHWSRWGSDSYPIVKAGRKWMVHHPAAPSMPLFPTHHAAACAWETLIAKWIRLDALWKAGQ